VGRADGVTEAELAALAEPAGNSLFNERERAALSFAEALAVGNSIPDDIFDRVRRSFTENEVVELTAVVAFEICAAKFNRALEIEAQGLCLIAGCLNVFGIAPTLLEPPFMGA